MKRRGIFLVIEGTDGSGKGTQFDLLKRRLVSENYDVAAFDFPQYGEPSAVPVEEYLNGRYGSSEEVGPYAGSLFFAVDRLAAKLSIAEALREGKVVISNRYTGSNMAHQGTKIDNPKNRQEYFRWLYDLEFQKCGLPVPDKSIVLRMPAEVAHKLVGQKGKRTYTDKKRDMHEADIAHLRRSVAVYDELCGLFPDEFTSIECAPGGQLLSVDEIHEMLTNKVYDLIKKSNQGK